MAEQQKNKNLILVVDDNFKNLQLIGNVLRQEEYEIAIATNGIQAIKTTKEIKPDLVLLDIMMPEMDGYEVCRQLKLDEETMEIPVIFLTAKTNSEEVIKGFEFGAVDYITKPFNNKELLLRVKTHLELKNSKEELRKINATKDKFFSIIAHDLKNPFITMLGFSSMLVTDYYEFSDEEKIEYLNEMEKVAKKSHQLLENLLQWSRSQTGRLEFIPKKFDFSVVVAETTTLLESQAKTKKINLLNKCIEGVEVFADEDMVNTIVRNLCSNAIKFTKEQGEISINCKKNDDKLEISIVDNGMGMDEKTLKNLFKIEYQQTKTGTANEQGTGLGLILCKEFTEKNNGEIWVESKLGQGSTFTFSIPLAK